MQVNAEIRKGLNSKWAFDTLILVRINSSPPWLYSYLLVCPTIQQICALFLHSQTIHHAPYWHSCMDMKFNMLKHDKIYITILSISHVKFKQSILLNCTRCGKICSELLCQHWKCLYIYLTNRKKQQLGRLFNLFISCQFHLSESLWK